MENRDNQKNVLYRKHGWIILSALILSATAAQADEQRVLKPFNDTEEADIITYLADRTNHDVTVHLAAGHYSFPGPIEIKGSNVTLEGEGRDATWLDFPITTQGANYGIIIRNRECTIRDLKLVGSAPVHRATTYNIVDHNWGRIWGYMIAWGSNAWRYPWDVSTTLSESSASGIYVDNSYCTISNVHIKQWWHGVTFANKPGQCADDGIIQNCMITCCYHGVYINGQGNDGVCIKDSYIGHNGGNGIRVDRQSGSTDAFNHGPAIIRILNNKIGENGLSGIHARCAMGLMIEGNYIEGNELRNVGPDTHTLPHAEIQLGSVSTDAGGLFNVSIRGNYFDLSYPTNNAWESSPSPGDYHMPYQNYGGVTSPAKYRLCGWGVNLYDNQNNWRRTDKTFSNAYTTDNEKSFDWNISSYSVR
jgi:hypothetical protein